MGCIALVIAASLKPKKYKALVMVAPAGFLEHDNLLALAARTLLKVVLSLLIAARHPSLLRATFVQERANLAYGFSWRTLQEIRCLPGIITGAWITQLREQGVEVCAIFGGRDRIYPFARCERMTARLTGYRIIPNEPHDLHLKAQARLLVAEIDLLLTGASTTPGGDTARHLCAAPLGVAHVWAV
jgi:pimeloyl-ACP methyl ester carboxylesterase